MTSPLTDAELDHRAEVARIDGNYLALELIRELRQLHTRVEAMAAVVAAAEAVEATCDAVGAIEVRDPKCSRDLSRIRRAYHALRTALDGYRAKVQR